MKPSTRPVAPTEPANESALPAPARAERPRFKVVVRESKAGPPSIGVAFENLQDLNDWQHEQFEAEVARLAGVGARILARALSGRSAADLSGGKLLGLAKRLVASFALALDVQAGAADATPSAAGSPRDLPDDSYVDQRCGRVPKEVYLRLHRQGAFPTTKVGKKIIARWGDVRRALAGTSKARTRSPERDVAKDDLDDLRREIGLEPKDGR